MGVKKQLKNEPGYYAGALLILSLLFTAVVRFLTIVDWASSRKIILLTAAVMSWVLLRFVLPFRGQKSDFIKKFLRLVDLFITAQRKLHPTFRTVIVKALFLQMANLAISMFILAIAGAAVFSFAESRMESFIHPLTATPTQTSTLLPTLTSTETLTQVSTFTSSPSPTSTPKAQGIYYMIVLDASVTMLEEFETQSKWEAARHAVESILEALEPQANYGLVVVGGTPPRDTSDPCDEPSRVALPFSSRDQVQTRISNIAVGGGGSLFSAFVLAKAQFSEAPEGTVQVLIYITGSEDACETEDEWADLERYFEIKGESGLDIYSEIIIIDSKDGVRTQTIAERISSLSSKVSVQAPQTDFQLIQINNGVINNVSNYVDTMIIMEAGGEMPAPTPTRTSLPIQVITPTRTSTIVIPHPAITVTSTPSWTPGFTQIPGINITPTSTNSPPPACPSYNRVLLQGPGYAGIVSIDTPADCSTGYTPETPIFSGGSYADIPNGTFIWELVFADNGRYYPQSPNACATGSPPDQSNGSWSVNTYLGTTGEDAKWYELVTVLTDQAASDYLSNWLVTHCNNFSGIEPAVLLGMNITEKSSIRLQTAGP